MLNPESWKTFTENLPLGRSIRVDHDCGNEQQQEREKRQQYAFDHGQEPGSPPARG